MPSPIHDLVRTNLVELLEDRRIVVFYDPSGVFGALVDTFDIPGLVAIDARTSMLEARRKADAAFAELSNPESSAVKRILIYVPWERARTETTRVHEPFEAYALMGASFGDKPDHGLDALARKAMPDRIADIDRLFASQGNPSLSQLEAFAQKIGFPLLAEALGTEDSFDIGAVLLLDSARARKALRKTGVQDELRRMLSDIFGFDAPDDVSAIRDVFARYVLFSEFAFDLSGMVPSHTENVARATAMYQKAIYALCDRMRDTVLLREAYMALADEVERALGLSGLATEARVFGERDTFAAEDTAALAYVSAQCMAGRLSEAQKALDLRKTSIWREVPERSQRWQLAQHALGVLQEAVKARANAVGVGRSVTEHVERYVADHDGLYGLDRAQRWMERAAGQCLERDSLEKLLEHARRIYQEAAEGAQVTFFEAVKHDGWPPEGLKQVQVFARHVAPALKQHGQCVAYFLVDALRYEMGKDLSKSLERLGTVRMEHAATVLPTTTPFGMAALMPGAEAGIGCAIVEGTLVPTVSGKRTASVDERRERFREHLGDRFVDVRLDDLLDGNDALLRERIGRASLVVVRSDDIDRAGEGTSGPSARRFMSGILDDLGRVAQRLARAGISKMIFAADHGHVLLSEVPPGDAVKAPPGRWVLEKRRCRVGAATARSEGVWVASAAHVGLVGPVEEVVFATGFRVFTAGSAYFHEGLSLQECVIPVISLDVRTEARTAAGPDRVDVLSKQPRFNSRVFMVRLKLVSLLQADTQVRVVVMDAETSRKVGRVVGCDAQDPATGLITVTVGIEVAVPIQIDEDYIGSEVVILVLHGSGTGLELGKKKLKNECSF